MIRQEDVYKIGRLGKPHGVKGEITFQFQDDVFDRVDADYLIIEVDGILVPFFIEEYRFRSDEVALLKLEDIDTQEAARQLTKSDVYFERRLSDEDEDRDSSLFTLHSSFLIGFCLVNDADGKEIGTISAIDDTTANVLFELEDGKLIPVAEEFIKTIDSDKREIRVTLPEGLLEL